MYSSPGTGEIITSCAILKYNTQTNTLDLSYVTVKSTVEISQNFVAFSEYVNFTLRNNAILSKVIYVANSCKMNKKDKK